MPSDVTRIPGVTGIKGLSQDKINEVLGKKHQKGWYGPALMEFLKSEEIGINPKEEWPIQLGDKGAAAIAQAFKNACDRAGIKHDKDDPNAVITIMTSKDEVFILHNERLRLWQALENSGLNDVIAATEVEDEEVDVDDEPVANEEVKLTEVAA
jgi:hypothetical protein